MGKKKKQNMPIDVAKAVWEEYANIYKERWTKHLSYAVGSENWDLVRKLGLEMTAFKFDFNRNKGK